MSYCVEHGIPHSVFLEWDPVDRAKTLAYREWESSLCPQCGTNNEDWVDEEGRFLDEPKYEMITIKCFGCGERHRLQDTIPNNAHGVYVVHVPYNPVKEPEVIAREREAKQREREMRLPEGGLFT